jgi:hypothetical protein
VIFYVDTPLLFLHVEPIWNLLRYYTDKIDFYFAVGETQLQKTLLLLQEKGVKKEKILSIPEMKKFYSADLFLSPTQWCFFPNGNQINVQIFHGLSSKGVSFPDDILQFDILFLASSVFKDMYLNVFLKKHPECKQVLYEVGYPKIDSLCNKKYDREMIFQTLNLDASKITVLYAPTYLSEGSFFRYGEEIIETILGMNVNLLVKLHPGLYNDPDNSNIVWLSGSTNWRELVSSYEKNANFRNITDVDSNPYLFITDILITDISSIAYEFMVLDRPIIYFDVPELFTEALPRVFNFSKEEAVRAYNDPRCTTGREIGLLVKSVSELKTAVNECIMEPTKMSQKRQETIKRLLYNPGCATQESASLILQLLHLSESKETK